MIMDVIFDKIKGGKVLLLLGFLLVSVVKSKAQFDPNKYKFERLSVEDGLPHSDALASVQDKQGFVWIATNKGLCRYDGYQLKPYHLPQNDQLILPNDRIQSLYVGSDSLLWVGTESNGIYIYDPTKDGFQALDFTLVKTMVVLVKTLKSAHISCISSDTEGNLWVGTAKNGLYKLQRRNKTAITAIIQIAPARSNPNFQVSNIGIDAQDNILVGTSIGLFYALPRTNMLVNTPWFEAKYIDQLLIDQHKNIWVASENHLYWLPNQKGQYQKLYRLQSEYSEVYALHLDSYNNLWIGSETKGLVMIQSKPKTVAGELPLVEEKMIKFEDNETGGADFNLRRIRHIYEDKFKVLWISTQAGGVSKLDLQQKQFGQLCPDKIGSRFKPTHYIKAICKDEARQLLWIGTWGGIVSYDFRSKQYKKYHVQNANNRLFNFDVSVIVKDSRQDIWVGTNSQGLYKLGNDGQFYLVKHKLGKGIVSALCTDAYGQMWLAIPSVGICLFNPNDESIKPFFPVKTSIQPQEVTFFFYDSSKHLLWVASKQGLYKYQIQQGGIRFLHRFTHQEGDVQSLKNNYIWALQQDKKGNLWIGSIGGGLHKLYVNAQGKDVIQRYDAFLPEQDVEIILEDENGTLWIGGTGLYRFNPANNQYIRYDVNDGLQSNSFKVGAAWKAVDGTLFFGGINGVSYFQPNTIKINTFAPIPQIVGLRVGNKLVQVGDTLDGRVLLNKVIDKQTKIVLNYFENNFAIDFVGLNYTNPHKNIYAYRLIGLSDDWITTQQQRNVNFSNLAPGTYTFEVKVANGDGIWSKEPATLSLVVLPPWWQTWWAYLIYTLIVAGGLWIYYRITETQRKLKEQLLIESLKYEKEKELSEMKLSFFTNVSHELRTPLTLILGPIEELVTAIRSSSNGLSEKAYLVQRQTRKLLELVNQLLEFRKVESGLISMQYRKTEAITFLREIFWIFGIKGEELDIEYTLEMPDEEVYFYIDREKIEIVLLNLLSNAFKFTPAKGNITMRISVVGSSTQTTVWKNQQLNDNFLVISLKDTGIGIEAKELSKIFDPYYQAAHTESLKVMGTGIGLSLVKQFVKAHGGEISVSSTVGVGTTFTVHLPLGKEHISTQSLIKEEDVFMESITSSDGTTQADQSLFKTGHQSNWHVLIVEDNAEIRLYLQQLFEKVYQVSTATDGQEGYEKALSTMPDVIISDIMMPEVNGLELCKMIRNNPKTLHVPVLLLTARTASIHEIEGLEMGADDYISKPFNPHVLLTKVTTLLQNRLKIKEYYSKQILQEPTHIVIPDEERVFLEKAMRIVEENLENSAFNVQALLKELGMSQPVLYRKIKGITGKSVVEFIRDVRLKRAAQLLSTSNLRVSEVTGMVGIEDSKYFRQHFQELFGCSPSEYAKTNKK